MAGKMIREIRPLTAAEQRMVEENIGLVSGFIKRYFPKGERDFDGYKQELMIGLMIAAQTFDPAKGAAFSTHASWRFMHQRSEWLRKKRNITTFTDLQTEKRYAENNDDGIESIMVAPPNSNSVVEDFWNFAHENLTTAELDDFLEFRNNERYNKRTSHGRSVGYSRRMVSIERIRNEFAME